MATHSSSVAMNGAATNGETAPAAAAAASTNRPLSKAAAPAKSADSNRKSTSSPVDGSQKRVSTPKAWASGNNPITKSAIPQQNGSVAHSNLPAAFNTAALSREHRAQDRQPNNNMTSLLGNIVGRSVSLVILNGDKFEGIFAGVSAEPGEPAYLLQMAKKLRSGDRTNGVSDPGYDHVGEGENRSMTFTAKEVVDLGVKGVSFDADMVSRGQNGPSSSFRTDTDISGNRVLKEKGLQRWDTPSDANIDLSLDSVASSGKPWDQFEANERLYGVRSDYDENIYTTAINRNTPQYRQREAAAERLAREIEGGSTMNSHVREERGVTQVDDSGLDEEEKYSGVQRGPSDFPPLQSGQTNKYTPPARRPPTGQATVRGAPVDPAIISSQIAREPAAAKKNIIEKVLSPSQSAQSSALKKETKTAETVAHKSAETSVSDASTKPVASTKQPTEREQHISVPATPPQPTVSSSPQANTVPPDSHTANVEREVVSAFKEFSNTERLRAQEYRRKQIKADKDVKLNDLLRFSQNFKLNTPIPKDLVSILAKDKVKQEEIVEKANRAAQTVPANNSGKKSAPVPSLVPTVRPMRTSASTRPENGAPNQDQKDLRRGGRNQYPPQGPYNVMPPRTDRSSQSQNLQAIPLRSGPGLSHRLAGTMASQAKAPVPSPISVQSGRLPSNGPSNVPDVPGSRGHSGAPTPTSAVSSRFNVKAVEFKPNPNAHSFTPTNDPSVTSSPQSNLNTRLASGVTTPSGFWGSRRPVPAADRPSSTEFFNPIKRLRREAIAAKEEWAENLGIPWAHRCSPRWENVKGENAEKTYKEMFELLEHSRFASAAMSPSASQGSVPPAHPHGLPFHQQGLQVHPQSQTPHPVPHHLQPGTPHHGGHPSHFDDHRMQYSASTSSVYQSPRLHQANMSYPSPMGQNAQLVYGAQMQPQFSLGPGGQQMNQFRQFPVNPQFIPQQMGQPGAPMMAHGPSNGPFMGLPQQMAPPFNQQMAVYGSPGQMHAYPQHGPPPPGSGGYPSPGRGAPMMLQQGSQQGHQQPPMMMYNISPGQPGAQMFMPQQPHGPAMRGNYHPNQPQYNNHHHQNHHYSQHRGAPGGNYGQQGAHHSSHHNGASGNPPSGPQSRGPEGEAENK